MGKTIELVRQEVAAMRGEVEDFANSAERVGGVVSDVLEYGHEQLTEGKNKHEALAERVTVAEGRIVALDGRITEVQQGSNAAIEALAQYAGEIDGNVAAETERAQAAELENRQKIEAEVTRAKGAEEANAKAIGDEVARAKEAEASLTEDIGVISGDLENEIQRAQAAEAAEVARAQAAEQALGTEITEAENRVDERVTEVRDNLEAEVQARSVAVTDLNANTGISEYPTFDPADDYAVGDVVVYEGRLRRFVAEHAAGEWNGTDVEEWSEKKEVEGKYAKISNGSNDFSITDEDGNAVLTLKDGHLEVKNFDSSKDATSKERGLMSAKDKDKLDNLGVATDNGSNDFSITDEDGNAVLTLKDGHLEVKNFNSKDATTGIKLDEPYSDGDFNIADENGNIILKLVDGHIKVKNFDSSVVEIIEPIFYAYKNSNTVSSGVIKVEKGDVVVVNDRGSVNSITVYEYMYNTATTPLLSKNIGKEGTYVVSNVNTSFIKIDATPNDDDVMMLDGVLYGNNSFVKNIIVYRKKKELSLTNVSAINNGWYKSEKSEFSEASSSINENTGSALTLSYIYDKLHELANDNSDYIEIEEIGYDSSEGKPVLHDVYSSALAEWTDDNGMLHIPVLKLTLTPSVVDVEPMRFKSVDEIPTIFFQFGIHPGEHPIIRGLMNFLIHLCRDWKSDDFLKYIRWNCRIIIIPVLVPYSYVDRTETPTYFGRCNYNGVNINRNYYGNGQWNKDSATEGGNNKGISYLSEVETKYSMRSLLESHAVVAYDWHTHGNFTSWKNLTCFATNPNYCKNEIIAKVGKYITKNLTLSGWKNHNLPVDSGYIGFVQNFQPSSFSSIVGDINIPTSSPEGLHRYYDGESGSVYNQDTDCMNEEMIVNTIIETLRNL